MYFGIESDIISQRLAPIISEAATNISESRRSISIDMTIAPIMINGERRTRRINIATACCAWLTSAVMRVISEVVENLSSSV